MSAEQLIRLVPDDELEQLIQAFLDECELANFSPQWKRYAMAYELGHWLNSDMDSVFLCHTNRWMHARQEKRASLAGAKVLIREVAVAELDSIDEIAAWCDVPREAVQLRVDSE